MVHDEAGVTLLVASTGGHLVELHHLRERLALGAVEWATFDTEQSRDLLAGEVVHHVPAVRPKDARNTLATVPVARRILRDRDVRRVVSTGAAVALPFIALARSRGLPAHYIESAARTDGPSLTGRLVSALPGTHLYAQHPWTTSSDRWVRRGSVFERYRAHEQERPRAVQRVVVSFGTQAGYSFHAAASAIARALTEVAPEAEVLWQVGDTDMSRLDVDHVASLPYSEMTRAIATADLVISHAGVGTALASLDAGRTPVLVPRRRSRGEHTDDHQVQIAADLARRGLAVHVEVDELTPEGIAAAFGKRVSRSAGPAFTLVP